LTSKICNLHKVIFLRTISVKIQLTMRPVKRLAQDCILKVVEQARQVQKIGGNNLQREM